MKTFLTIILVLAFAVSCFAVTTKELVLLNTTSSSTGTAYRVDMVHKSVTFAGYSTQTAPTTLGLYVPGTATLQVAPTSSGPWVTAKDVANTAVTNANTTASTFNLQTAFKWVRVVYTKALNSRYIKVFLTGMSDN